MLCPRRSSCEHGEQHAYKAGNQDDRVSKKNVKFRHSWRLLPPSQPGCLPGVVTARRVEQSTDVGFLFGLFLLLLFLDFLSRSSTTGTTAAATSTGGDSSKLLGTLSNESIKVLKQIIELQNKDQQKLEVERAIEVRWRCGAMLRCAAEWRGELGDSSDIQGS